MAKENSFLQSKTFNIFWSSSILWITQTFFNFPSTFQCVSCITYINNNNNYYHSDCSIRAVPFCPGGLGRNLARGSNFIGSMKNWKDSQHKDKISTYSVSISNSATTIEYIKTPSTFTYNTPFGFYWKMKPSCPDSIWLKNTKFKEVKEIRIAAFAHVWTFIHFHGQWIILSVGKNMLTCHCQLILIPYKTIAEPAFSSNKKQIETTYIFHYCPTTVKTLQLRQLQVMLLELSQW